MLLKDIEKSMSGSTDSYATLKNKLEFMPQGVLIIGLHSQVDNRKEKVVLSFFNMYCFLNVHPWIWNSFSFMLNK